MICYIDKYREQFGVEPICKVLPIAPSTYYSHKHLERNPDGGVHHLCYEVEDITAASRQLTEQGARVLGGGEPKIGAHGKPVLFLHPKDFCGTLVELEEVADARAASAG